jgi:uncharacterized protein YprB with RNaseH-like and TPR domain
VRILSWDLECSGLNADFGVILCCGFLEVGTKKAEVLNVLDYIDGEFDLIKAEKKLLKDITKRLLDCDVWLTHFGTWYDINFVNTRLIYHRLPILPPNIQPHRYLEDQPQSAQVPEQSPDHHLRIPRDGRGERRHPS